MAVQALSPSPLEARVLARVLADPARVLDSRAAANGWLREVTPHPHRLVSRMAEHGLLHRVQRGLYVLEASTIRHEVPAVESLKAVAAVAAEQIVGSAYYLSWHSALFHHGLLDQQASTVFVGVRARKSEISFSGYGLRFVRVSDRKFFGWDTVNVSGHSVNIANVEKALLDSLDRPALAAPFAIVVSALLGAWRSSRLDIEQLVDYAVRLGSPTLNRRLGFLMETFDIPGHERLLTLIGKGYAVSAPGAVATGRRWPVNSKWGVMADPRILYAAENPK